MQTALVIALSLHVLSSVFWAGSSFALARTGGAGGEQLVFPQLGAATIAILTGGYLGHLVHAGSFGTTEQVLAAGVGLRADGRWDSSCNWGARGFHLAPRHGRSRWCSIAHRDRTTRRGRTARHHCALHGCRALHLRDLRRLLP